MRSIFKAIGLLLLAGVACCALSFRKSNQTPEDAIRQTLVVQADSLAAIVKLMQRTPADAAHEKRLQQLFVKARLVYKRMEWASEYFDPITTRKVNGPPVPETELTGQVILPDGFQVIEQLLYPQVKAWNKEQLTTLLKSLSENAAEYQRFFSQADLQNWQIWDAVKLEVFRVETLGLNRFDDPLEGHCFRESAAALESVSRVISQYNALVDFTPAIHYLLRDITFNRFDRASFLLNFANPLTRQLAKARKALKMPDIRYNRLLNQHAATLFDSNAFNRNAFIAAPEDSATELKINLGKKLFFDPILSGNGQRSCSSCHQPDRAFTDGLAKNLDITGKKFIKRNTPTLINAALQPAQFYDLRAPSLEDQVSDVVGNRDEMHGDMQVSTEKLWHDLVYKELFSRAYPVTDRQAIDTLEVMNALASFVRSLTALNSRFDAYMQGDSKALTVNEVAGFNFFMGKARCATCHYLPLFSGALPPRYVQMDAEVIGVPQTAAGQRIDPDPGVYAISPVDFNKHSFKVPSVRNIARTAPYMHNGAFKTLEQVVDFYNLGGGQGLGFKLANQTLPSDHLGLTATEEKQLIAFMKSLDSR
jgi:cytochrome c peroxidase